ncbi:hypothetical protein Tco_1312834 [Tanacetum coccineum]
MFSELLNGNSPVVSKSSAVHAADNPDKRQQHNTTHTSTTTNVADPPPLNIHSTHQTPTQVPTVTAPENIIQAETNTENAQFDDDEFINIFSTPVQDQGDSAHRHGEAQKEGIDSKSICTMLGWNCNDFRYAYAAHKPSQWYQMRFKTTFLYDLKGRSVKTNQMDLLTPNHPDKVNQSSISINVLRTSTKSVKFFFRNSDHILLVYLINQAKYAHEKLLKHVYMTLIDAIGTPMTSKHTLMADLDVDQGSQIKMIQVKEMMQDNDLKNSKSKDKGSKSRSQSMDEQSHYKQDKTITRQSINVKRHIFNVIGGTEEFEERDLNIGGDC